MVSPTLRVDLPFSVNIDKNTAENPSRTCPEVCSHDSKSYQVDDQDQPPRVKHMKSFKNNKLIRTLKRCTQDSDPAGDHPELNKHAIILSSDWPLWVKSRTLSPSITEHFEVVVWCNNGTLRRDRSVIQLPRSPVVHWRLCFSKAFSML